eukprot:288642_1
MALALADKKEEEKDNGWNTDSYNSASQILFNAAKEDLDDFKIDEHPIIDLKKSIIKFPNVICPKIEIRFFSMSKHYDKYPLKLEIIYQYKSTLMIYKENEKK